MKYAAITLSLAVALAACGSPKEEDKLSPEDIRASESAPELPDIALSENPEPEPAPPEAIPPANELQNALEENGVGMEGEEQIPPGIAPIPAAFHGRWGATVEDCIDPRREGSEAVVIGSSRIELPEASGQLFQTMGNFPERFIGMFVYNGDSGRWSQKEELSLTGSSNVLIRDADGERFRYRRCVRPKV
jgi:hypothetical protein